MMTLQVQVHQHHLAKRELAGNEQLVLQSVHLWTSQRKILMRLLYVTQSNAHNWTRTCDHCTSVCLL